MSLPLSLSLSLSLPAFQHQWGLSFKSKGQLWGRRFVLPGDLDQRLQRAAQRLGQFFLLALPQRGGAEAVIAGRSVIDLLGDFRQGGQQLFRVAVGHAGVEPFQDQVVDRAERQHVESDLGQLARLQAHGVGGPEVKRALGISLQAAARPGLIGAKALGQARRQGRKIAARGCRLYVRGADEFLLRGGVGDRVGGADVAHGRIVKERQRGGPVGRGFPLLPVVGQVGAAEEQPAAGAGDGLVKEGRLVAPQAQFDGEAALGQPCPVGFAQQRVLPLGAGEVALRQSQQSDGVKRQPPRIHHRGDHRGVALDRRLVGGLIDGLGQLGGECFVGQDGILLYYGRFGQHEAAQDVLEGEQGGRVALGGGAVAVGAGGYAQQRNQVCVKNLVSGGLADQPFDPGHSLAQSGGRGWCDQVHDLLENSFQPRCFLACRRPAAGQSLVILAGSLGFLGGAFR